MSGPATGFILGERYRLQERIASGGMGTVWMAHDETLHRPVAVKVLNEGLSADGRFTERFRREARADAALSHPAIAGVYDYGEEDGRPYIVMELIEGETLADLLHRVGPLPPEEVARIGAAASDALAYAHTSGLVHRDVKPANIMLTSADRQVKVMDFGIAAPLEGGTGLTATGAVMGTSRYITPEQAEGERATPASDVYSLGVVLYELLAGRPPFVRESSVATALAHIHERPEAIRDLRPEIPARLADLVHECLSKDPSHRPSASSLAEELRAPAGGDVAAATEPIPVSGDTEALRPKELAVAAPPTEELTPRRGRFSLPVPSVTPTRSRGVRRARWLVGAAVVAVGLLILALIASSGTSHVRVPGFIGELRSKAVARAERLGLDPLVQPVDSDEPEGIVVGQRPRRGLEVLDGTPIVLRVSNGSAVVTTSPPAEPPASEGGHGKGHGRGHGGGKGHEEGD